MVLFPDDWDAGIYPLPEYAINPDIGYDEYGDAMYYVDISMDDWNQLFEPLGVVFLPFQHHSVCALSDELAGEWYNAHTLYTGTYPDQTFFTLSLGINYGLFASYDDGGVGWDYVEGSKDGYSLPMTLLGYAQNEGFALYTDHGWEGTLTHLVPGQGYVYVSVENGSKIVAF